MSDYTNLRRRLEDREVIFLDGAIGTQLQSMGVPMDNDAWCALAFMWCNKVTRIGCGSCC